MKEIEISKWLFELKFMFSKKATKINEIFTVDLMVTTYCQIEGEDFVNFCCLFRKYELYQQDRTANPALPEEVGFFSVLVYSQKNPKHFKFF